MAEKDNNNMEEARTESPHSVPTGNQDNENKKSKFPGVNLYVKNLDDSFNDDFLREAFDEFGTITSAKVMCDASGHSKGFGFVCFTNQKEANKALTKMNGRIVGTKPLYVAMAQKKEERKQYLSDRYKNFNMNSSVPFTSPPASQPAPAAPQSVESPTHVQYVPNNPVVQQPVQYRFFPGNFQWPATGPSPYVVPQPGPVSHAVAYTPYQPLYMVPGLNMMAPPQQMPILHRPIYIHSSKSNTLIYSTGVQAAPPPVSSPSSYVTTTSGNEEGRMMVPQVQNDGDSPQPNTNFKDTESNTQSHVQHPAGYSSVNSSQAQNQHDASAAYGQIAYSGNYNISLNNGFTT